MKDLRYTDDQTDLLKEVFNTAMGQAGAGLATLLNSFVNLSVPAIRIVEAEKVIDAIIADSAFKEDDIVSAIRQTFFNENAVDGETIVFFNEAAFKVVAEVMGISGVLDRRQQAELMLEMSNILSGASINGFSRNLFGNEMSFSPPTILSDPVDLRKLLFSVFMRRRLKWDYTMMVKIKFKLKDKDMKCDLLIFLSERSIETIRRALDEQLAKM